MRATTTVTMVALVLLTGCGKFVSSDAKAPATTAPAQAKVGEGLADQITTTTPTSAPAAGGRTPPTTAPAAASPNPAVRDDPAGFRLTLTVEGDLDYAADEPFRMKLEVRNISKSPKRYDPNQQGHFVMTGAGRWRDTDCGPRTGGGAPAVTLAPNEAVTVEARYPGPDDRLDHGAACQRPPGDYLLGAGFLWCPDGTLLPDGRCDPERTQTLRSAGVRLTLS